MKKIPLLLCAFLFLSAQALSALPGVADFLPTESGRYVYYRDSANAAGAYIGFLQYDEGTYAIRFYSPRAERGSKELNVFISLDTNKDYVSMTGEKVLETLKPEDADTLNYLHDLFYEFASRRKKLDKAEFGAKAARMERCTKTEEATLFGGKYTFIYDFAVPIFNLCEIKNESGKTLFGAVTVGTLSSSSDTAFSAFKGLPENAGSVEPVNAFSSGSENLAQTERETMDGLLRQITDNFWFWESEALMYTDFLQTEANAFAGKAYGPFHLFAARLSGAGNDTIVCFEKQSRIFSADALFLANCIYDRASHRFVYDIQIIKKKEPTVFEIAGFKIFAEYYSAHKAYFNRLMNATFTAP